MTSILQSLKLTSAQRSPSLSPIIKRRNKLADALYHQMNAAIAARDGSTYYIKAVRRIKNVETGNFSDCVVEKRVKQMWWIGDNGKCYLQVRYGWKPLEFAKGKSTIEVDGYDALVTTLESLKQAALSGELDTPLNAALSDVSARMNAGRKASNPD
jgi:hypothetical protein